METKTCRECEHFSYSDEGRCMDDEWTYSDSDACEKFKPKTVTVFHRITASPELLAEKLVYEDFGGWWSVLFDDDCNWDSRDEAIDATVAKLKEVLA